MNTYDTIIAACAPHLERQRALHEYWRASNARAIEFTRLCQWETREMVKECVTVRVKLAEARNILKGRGTR